MKDNTQRITKDKVRQSEENLDKLKRGEITYAEYFGNEFVKWDSTKEEKLLFSACSKSKRDLCFSYATTYNLVDAFLSFKVLHETDAQRSHAWHQLPNRMFKRIINKQIMSNETLKAIVPNVC